MLNTKFYSTILHLPIIKLLDYEILQYLKLLHIENYKEVFEFIKNNNKNLEFVQSSNEDFSNRLVFFKDGYKYSLLTSMPKIKNLNFPIDHIVKSKIYIDKNIKPDTNVIIKSNQLIILDEELYYNKFIKILNYNNLLKIIHKIETSFNISNVELIDIDEKYFSKNYHILLKFKSNDNYHIYMINSYHFLLKILNILNTNNINYIHKKYFIAIKSFSQIENLIN